MAAAEDIGDGILLVGTAVGGLLLGCAVCTIDIYISITQRCTGGIVGTIDIATYDGVAGVGGRESAVGGTDVDGGVALGGIGLVAYRGHLAATIDVSVDGTVGEVDCGIAIGAAGEALHAVAESHSRDGINGGATVAATIYIAFVECTVDDTADDGVARDVDGGVLGNGAHLRATVDVTLDHYVAGDVHLGLLGAAKSLP